MSERKSCFDRDFATQYLKIPNGAMTVHIGVWSWTARVSALLLYDFGKQDAIIKAQRRHGKWQFSSTGAAFASQLQACAFTICKKRETVISPAENSPPKLNH